MSNKPFFYQDPFPLKKDDTEYYLLTSEHVSVAEFEGQEILIYGWRRIAWKKRNGVSCVGYCYSSRYQANTDGTA
ncbi:hypothetical protein L247_01300 [Salmonella enterica subsp. enterica serovar Worthington str. BCH-7253]|nr:hypothetical protein L247_01300 [Salmonella enterica subsp. enterica serovar Worthington str. BCH-7253]